MKQMIVNFIRDEEGLTTVEYAIAGGLIAATLVAVFRNIGIQALAKLNDLLAALT